jgi:maltooligosyltrehalose trehalohydrolase
MKGDRLNKLVPFEALKLAAGIVLLSPYIPLVFMGEEYGERAPFQYFVSHSDQGLIEAVRRGRKEEFEAFQWGEEVADPQREATFLRSKIDLGLHQQENHNVLFGFYKCLIRLRKEVSSLTRKNMEIHLFEGTKAVLMTRRCDGDQTISIFNFDSNPSEVQSLFEKGLWQKAFDSSSEIWGGPGGIAPETIHSNGTQIFSCKLNPYSFVLYKQ